MTANSLDWDQLRRRVQKIQSDLEWDAAVSPAEREKILKDRAKLLAQRERKDAEGERLEVVEFLLAYERYAFETSFVREVYPLKDLTPIAGAPSFVLGIINVRGRILSVVDLRKIFELPAKGLTDLNKVIIIGNASMEYGVVSDAILGVRSVPLGNIQSSLPTLTGLRDAYLKGVTNDQVVILDAGKLLGDEKLVLHE